MIHENFWKTKKVFITGHTGFKGSWLCLWLNSLGAEITGYALKPLTNPSLFEICKIKDLVNSIIGDIRDYQRLDKAIKKANPEIIFHLAAQPIVRESYKSPTETYQVNVMGTVNLLESVRTCKKIRAVINVTSDKCYENRDLQRGYRENDPLGGYDPYSSSKACSELVTSSYRNSFFNPEDYHLHGVGLASARSGNVIGGGDWSQDRLVPDCIRAILKREKIIVRNPDFIRPWQHVLEPLSGYLMLAQKIYENGLEYSGAWNFGPDDKDIKTVEWIVKKICEKWGHGLSYKKDKKDQPHEARYLKLDCAKAKAKLGWTPKWTLETAIDKTIEWVQAYRGGKDMKSVCIGQINEYSD